MFCSFLNQLKVRSIFTVIFLFFLALECLALLAKLKITYGNNLLKYKPDKANALRQEIENDM